MEEILKLIIKIHKSFLNFFSQFFGKKSYIKGLKSIFQIFAFATAIACKFILFKYGIMKQINSIIRAIQYAYFLDNSEIERLEKSGKNSVRNYVIRMILSILKCIVDYHATILITTLNLDLGLLVIIIPTCYAFLLKYTLVVLIIFAALKFIEEAIYHILTNNGELKTNLFIKDTIFKVAEKWFGTLVRDLSLGLINQLVIYGILIFATSPIAAFSLFLFAGIAQYVITEFARSTIKEIENNLLKDTLTLLANIPVIQYIVYSANFIVTNVCTIIFFKQQDDIYDTEASKYSFNDWCGKYVPKEISNTLSSIAEILPEWDISKTTKTM